MVEKQAKATIFQGDRDSCLRFLSGKSGYYTYILLRPDGRPFYVGKGTGLRVLQHENEARHPNDRRSNAHKLNVIRAIGRSRENLVYEIDAFFEDELSAYGREEALIAKHKRLHEGGILTNRAPGGGSISGPSPFSLERHAATLGGIPEDDPETATLNRFVLAIGPMRSVVLKPSSRFKPRPTQVFPRVRRSFSPRQAIALAATAAANGIVLNGGARLPRSVMIDEVSGFVENGVSCDIATSGLATVVASDDPANEMFVLSNDQVRSVVGFIGLKKASDLGIFEANI